MSKAFLSYVHEDSEFAEKLARNFQRNGIGVWRDKEELSGGLRWKSAIRKAITEGTYFVALHSAQREKKQNSYAHAELAIAIEELQKKPQNRRWLIPLRIDDCEIDDRTIGGGETYLDLHVHDLRDFEQGVVSLLKSLGVDEPKLAEKKSRKNRRGEFVAPQGSPFNAVSALQEFASIGQDVPISTDALYTALGENTIRDLSTLGLIKSSPRGYWKLTDPVDDPRLALTIAIAKMPPFQVAVAEMQKDFSISSKLLGKKVAEYLGRHWSETSCQRNGAAYKRWIVNLYPNFQLPKVGDPSYLAARSQTQPKTKNGRATFLTPDVLLKISSMKQQGQKVTDIARKLGMTPQVIYNWRRANPEKWAAL